jgi:hypothetical protein
LLQTHSNIKISDVNNDKKYGIIAQYPAAVALAKIGVPSI